MDPRQLSDLALASMAAGANWRLGTWLQLRKPFWMAGSAASLAGILMGVRPIMRRLPQNDLFDWLRAIGFSWAIASTFACLFYFLLRWWSRSLAHDPARRRLLRIGTAPVLASPALILGYGILGRNRFALKTIDIHIPQLPPGLVGLRLVQLTDIHMSPFLTATELEHAVGMANETNAHIALVTGDLITMRKDPLDQCLRILSKLRSSDGVYGCLGNHEIFASCEAYATAEAARYGIRFLRTQSEQLRIGGARLNLAGVDYQKMGGPYLPGAASLLQPGSINILLSHNPDVFPVAAQMGYDLTVAGHTHGGQITVEILHQYANAARFFTPYVSGLYQRGQSSLYVSRGLGTVGVPARLGAPPEVTLLRLCAG